MKKLRRALIIFTTLCAVSLIAQADDPPASKLSEDADDGATLHLAGLIIHAADIEKSITFYAEVMGLKTVGRVEKDGKLHEILLSTSGKFLNGMMLTIQHAKDSSASVKPESEGFGTIIFMTENNETVAQRMRAAGTAVTVRDPKHLIAHDPDGYRLMIYQFDPRMLNAK